jgi:hypothetical protein
VGDGVSGLAQTAPDDGRASYAGWVAGAIVILGVLVVGVGFWFTHHP